MIVLVAALALGSSAAGDDRMPGVAAGVASVSALPPQASLPPQVRMAVERMAAETGTERARALANVRRLRSNLGVLESELYAFRAATGSVCWILTNFVGSCPDSPERGSPGLQWTIGGGYDNVPGALVGIAADDVRAVQLVLDGRLYSASLVNNAVFAEVPRDARRAEIVIRHRDGTTNSVHVALNG
jgi:hypothetical protein